MGSSLAQALCVLVLLGLAFVYVYKLGKIDGFYEGKDLFQSKESKNREKKARKVLADIKKGK